MAIRTVVSGATGKMGQTLAGLIAHDPDLQLVGGIDREAMDAAAAGPYGFSVVQTAAGAKALLAGVDVVLDFSAPAGLKTLLTSCTPDLAGKALVVGTTGLTSDIHELLAAAAERSAVIVSANFSIGVNLMLALVGAAARVLDETRYDVEIVESHHKRKVDAPSGTALALGDAIAAARGSRLHSVRRDGRSGHVGPRASGEIGLHALRGGEIVGEHRVEFIGERDRLEFTHIAQDRALFAEGALFAAKWIAGKPAGRYSMTQVLRLDRQTGE